VKVDIFAGEIDFHRDLRPGDGFAVVFETLNHGGRPIRSSRVLAAEFTSQKKTYRAVWFQDPWGTGGYYTPEGANLRKAFLRSPLEFSRVTSGFGMRRHPVFQHWHAHQGVDYGAPVGTRVRATGDGVWCSRIAERHGNLADLSTTADTARTTRTSGVSRGA
jgi:murein DD-endopeptidase MepM/ murein hydrolase activator NlpD